MALLNMNIFIRSIVAIIVTVTCTITPVQSKFENYANSPHTFGTMTTPLGEVFRVRGLALLEEIQCVCYKPC